MFRYRTIGLEASNIGDVQTVATERRKQMEPEDYDCSSRYFRPRAVHVERFGFVAYDRFDRYVCVRLFRTDERLWKIFSLIFGRNSPTLASNDSFVIIRGALDNGAIFFFSIVLVCTCLSLSSSVCRPWFDTVSAYERTFRLLNDRG